MMKLEPYIKWLEYRDWTFLYTDDRVMCGDEEWFILNKIDTNRFMLYKDTEQGARITKTADRDEIGLLEANLTLVDRLYWSRFKPGKIVIDTQTENYWYVLAGPNRFEQYIVKSIADPMSTARFYRSELESAD